MKRRLRKKKHVGEFKQLGFELHGDLQSGLARADQEAFLDRLLSFVEARELSFGGGVGRGAFGGFVAHEPRGNATNDDRAAVSQFLDGDAVVVRHTVGALTDAWYGFDQKP